MQRKQLVVAAVVGVLAGHAWAINVTWDNSAGSGDRSWFTSTNWDTNVVPTQAANSDVKINDGTLSSSGNPVVINSVSAASFRQLDIGVASGQSGFLTIQSDVSNTSTNSHAIGNAGSGTVTHSAGTVAIARAVTLGTASTGSGTWNATGGTLNQGGFGFNVGLAGTGSLSASNNAALNLGGGLSVAVNDGSTGTVSISGTATIALAGNNLSVGGASGVGTGSALLTIKQASGNAVTQTGTNARTFVGPSGEIRGYGTISTTTAAGANVMLTNNGRVVADGEGTDRTLQWTTGNVTTNTTADRNNNTVDNTSNKGFFAINHGKLVIPAIPLGLNDASPSNVSAKEVNFGEARSSADAVIDMVNSARFSFTTSITNAAATVSLLDDERTDVLAAPSGVSFIGIWNLALTSGSINNALTGINYQFRYDDVAAGANTPVLYRLVGGLTPSWQVLTSSVNGTTDILSTSDSNITTFNNTFAIGVPVPEPTTLSLLSVAAMPLLRRRKR